MSNKKITEKIKEMLTPEDFKQLESAIEDLVNKRVALSEEEMKNKYDALAEEYVQKQVKELSESNKASLIEEYDAKLQAIEKKVVTKLGAFLDHVIMEQISDAAIEKLALNEVSAPIIDGIKKLFSKNYIELDTTGSDLLKAEQKKVTKLESDLSNATAKILENEKRLEAAANMLLISEKTEGMVNSQKQRVAKMFKNKPFEETKENIDTFVTMIRESKETVKPKNEDKGTLSEIISEGDHIPEEKAVMKETDEDMTFAAKANRYLAE
jgi:hypothetical protein